MKLAVHHIALPTHNLAQAEIFYSQVMGLDFLEYQYDDQKNKRSIWYQLDHDVILMIELTPHPTTKNENQVLAFEIIKEQRADWIQKLVQNKIPILKETPSTIYFEDPDGNPLALSHYPALSLK
ncbi:MAG: lactoylglutathione lyase [uncultured bacterium]|nr:MAG: lactoylglutathione lyase [uncultured bacterium]